MPSEKEIKKIIELYDNGNGLSHGQIAKKVNYDQSTITRTINKWLGKNRDAEGNAHESVHQCKTKNAIEAKKTFDRARRLALNDAFFEKISEMMKVVDKPSGLRDLAVSYGIIEDKRQIIEPLVPEGKGSAAIDIFIEELRREASEDEPQTAE